MEYKINNVYGYDKDYSYLDRVIKRTLMKEKALASIFSIIFVSEEEIQTINKTYRQIDKVTDVISFAFEDNKDDFMLENRVLGDIYICIPRMISQAKEYGHSFLRELSFLTIHGLLHLLGYDHMTKEEEEIMFKKQDELLNEFGITR